MKTTILTFLILISVINILHAQTSINAFVLNCNDGDTCKMKVNNQIIKIRLVGIDAPELKHGKKTAQPYAQKSKDELNNLIKDKNVSVKLHKKDIYKRYLGEIFYKNINVNLKMLEIGAAEVYKGKNEKSIDLTTYIEKENVAKQNHIGIWNNKNYESPFIFRKK